MGTIEAAFQKAIESGTAKGALIAATNSAGSFTYTNPIGNRTLLSGETQPHQPSDILYLASATKLLTAIAALQCVEDGLLSLDGDLSTIAPELASKQVLTGFSDDQELILVPAERNITLRHLLTHSSGIVYHFMNPDIATWREKFATPERKEGTRLKVEELFNYPLAFQPGTSWMYGPGLDWAGRIIERVTGKTLIERMQESLFTPLGISNGQFYPVTREELKSRLVDLTPEDPEVLGKAVLGGNGDMNTRTDGGFGGHGLFLSGESYIKILRSLLANDNKILKTEYVEELFRHQLNEQSQRGLQSAVESPMGIFFRVGMETGTKFGHALGGIMTREDLDGWYGEGTMSWGGGQTFAWFIDRKNDLCGLGAVLATVPLDVQAAAELKQVFRKDIYRKYEAWKGEQ
ncbi:beta-lactamase/transpeptidase-like protein [Aspergillus karnatakaensis]|uniref:serine hydrolase domain-containing protein n=1 Tax=Aspergillus karnatakaensis TaxID=1810916 RepID=UPI003CCD86C7